ncbi:hypothetical protein PRIPAC_97837 [Pristionchus pacificus]|uniref:Uncharacterized protein n=1 Tax=Pristionchus pacificus TaxID=54126 RepID=A0A454Y1W9_PRIPA|nr:hypothetical protein PRIPAC_97837 [Pristionchus pacificus]|eukprot:PDM84617.1 hypothetical protein PRIPAC_33640 [Pristionchus pacificus]
MENYVALLIALASIITIILLTSCCKRLAYIEDLDDLELSEVHVSSPSEVPAQEDLCEQQIAPSMGDGDETKESF